MLLLKFNHLRLFPVIACLVWTIGLIGCSEKPIPTPTEAESFAARVINARFVERDGRWLALEKASGKAKPRMIELNKPTIQFNAGQVSATDQMNGITQRCTLSVFCEQFRYRTDTWSAWQTGTGGSKQGLVNALTGGTLAYQYYQMEKKNGVWVVSGAKPPALITDQNQIQSAVLSALGPP